MSRKLYKKRNGAMFFGVLNGIADFIGIDAIIVRFVYIVLGLVFHSFPAIILYIILTVIIPGEEKSKYTNYDIR
ncbi:PspC domain-containing protein [Anaerofustis sp.]|uniref:PspC domain-containing protein n=1 Tax=Anaerofustis sp. TaxID=1872517 RepID=UPI0025C05602|nr:PspC domain-containing protein [Anaerofustis sp.]